MSIGEKYPPYTAIADFNLYNNEFKSMNLPTHLNLILLKIYQHYNPPHLWWEALFSDQSEIYSNPNNLIGTARRNIKNLPIWFDHKKHHDKIPISLTVDKQPNEKLQIQFVDSQAFKFNSDDPIKEDIHPPNSFPMPIDLQQSSMGSNFLNFSVSEPAFSSDLYLYGSAITYGDVLQGGPIVLQTNYRPPNPFLFWAVPIDEAIKVIDQFKIEALDKFTTNQHIDIDGSFRFIVSMINIIDNDSILYTKRGVNGFKLTLINDNGMYFVKALKKIEQILIKCKEIITSFSDF
jgi:hypothetical protein